MVALFQSPPGSIARLMTPSALDGVFDAEASLLALAGGATLIRAGETAPALYRLVAGRLAEVESLSGHAERVTAVHRPGAVIGAAQILAAAPFRTTLTALRDSELLAIPEDRAQALMRENPAFLAEVARIALARLGSAEPADPRRGTILGFIAVCESIAMRDLTERIAAAMRGLGVSVAVIGAESMNASPAELSRLEAGHDFVLMAAERREERFTAFCGRQIDRLVLVGGADTPAPPGPFQFAAAAIQRHNLLDVVLQQPDDGRRPAGSDRWLAAAPASRLFQIRAGRPADVARLARVYAGKSVGLALSGGGARAYAHVGAIRALGELGVPIDFVGGASMGAVIAAGLAMGWATSELEARIRAAFVESSPLADIAFPLLAMTRGRMVDRRLRDHFEEARISDLWRPFLCVSTDLTSGGPHVHRQGLVRQAVRASLSLPGVLPPVVEDDHVLVDGALVRNLPVDLVRDQHDGVTIGVDVAVSEALRPGDLTLRPSGWRWLTSGAWRKGPPIVSVLIRSATLPSVTALARAWTPASVDIVPDVEGVELQDWAAYGPAADAGYRATMASADRLAPLRA
jgi:NTE family protein